MLVHLNLWLSKNKSQWTLLWRMGKSKLERRVQEQVLYGYIIQDPLKLEDIGLIFDETVFEVNRKKVIDSTEFSLKNGNDTFKDCIMNKTENCLSPPTPTAAGWIGCYCTNLVSKIIQDITKKAEQDQINVSLTII